MSKLRRFLHRLLWGSPPPARPRDRYQPGERRRNSTYMPSSVEHDGTPQWVGEFPPAGHVDPEPHVGMPATVFHAPVLRRAVVTAVERGRVQVRVEYGKRHGWFTKRRDGTYREEGLRGKAARRLVLGIAASNLKSFKMWYNDRELAAGPIRDGDFKGEG